MIATITTFWPWPFILWHWMSSAFHKHILFYTLNPINTFTVIIDLWILMLLKTCTLRKFLWVIWLGDGAWRRDKRFWKSVVKLVYFELLWTWWAVRYRNLLDLRQRETKTISPGKCTNVWAFENSKVYFGFFVISACIVDLTMNNRKYQCI